MGPVSAAAVVAETAWSEVVDEFAASRTRPVALPRGQRGQRAQPGVTPRRCLGRRPSAGGRGPRVRPGASPDGRPIRPPRDRPARRMGLSRGEPGCARVDRDGRGAGADRASAWTGRASACRTPSTSAASARVSPSAGRPTGWWQPACSGSSWTPAAISPRAARRRRVVHGSSASRIRLVATDPLAVVALRDGAIATSSIRRQRWTTDGGERHHLVDPRTGEPADGGLLAVTVAAADPAWAEVWSKALFVAGRAAIPGEARAHGLAAWWVEQGRPYRDDGGRPAAHDLGRRRGLGGLDLNLGPTNLPPTRIGQSEPPAKGRVDLDVGARPGGPSTGSATVRTSRTSMVAGNEEHETDDRTI